MQRKLKKTRKTNLKSQSKTEKPQTLTTHRYRSLCIADWSQQQWSTLMLMFNSPYCDFLTWSPQDLRDYQ